MFVYKWGGCSTKREGKEDQVGMPRSAQLLARLRYFKDDAAGDVAIMFGLLAFVMFMFVGAAVDMGRWMHARKQMLDAVDAAVLAGGRELQTTGNETSAIAAAEKFFNESIEGRLHGVTLDVNFNTAEVDGGLTMGVTAASFATIKTPFMSLGGVATLPLLSVGGAEWSEAKIGTEGNAHQNYEISMMLDVSGSMNTPATKIADLRLAAEDLIKIVVWNDQSEYTSRIALVPFSGEVRPPLSTLTAVRGNPPASKVISGKTHYRSNCVGERHGTEKYSDAAPATGQYSVAIYDRTKVTENGNSNTGKCDTPVNAAMMPMTSDKEALINKVKTMSIGSGTAGHVGTAWAWYALAPNWNSVWGGSASNAAAYDDTGTKKIAILMTDGEYNTPYATSGVSGTSPNGTPQAQATALCTAMKAKGITVYTVAFDLDDAAAQTLLSNCATDPSKFFNATDGAALRQAFRTIALEISSLYLDK